MTMLYELPGPWMVHVLGWTLLHFCWQGAAVAAAVWCALQLLEGRSSKARYAVTALGLAAMVVLPVATFVRVAANDRAALLRMPVISFSLTVGAGGGGGALALPWRDRVAAMADAASPWLSALWLAGVLVFLARLNVGLLLARRMRTVDTEEAPAELQAIFRGVARRLGVERVSALLHSARVQAPTVIGWLRPVVLMPVGCLAGLSTVQVEALLAHELAHIRRHDYLVSIVQSVVEAVLFFHPGVWWVSAQLRRERECCCDEMAVRVGGDALAYARALSLLETRRALLPEVVLGANGGVLTMRIKRLLGCKSSSLGSQGMALAMLLAATVSAACCVSSVARAQIRTAVNRLPAVLRLAARDRREAELIEPAMLEDAVTGSSEPRLRGASVQQAAAQAASGMRMSPAYTNWLDQDVVWIITPEERAAYLQLSSDDERDKFIEQFWARRNPQGTAENTYRQEHYARIAYANEHFAAGRPGWKTDRGHIYIAYGKPDSIDSHPSGGAASGYPFEVWHYRTLSGLGDNVDLEFVDTCQCGDYRYTIDRTQKDALKNAPGSGAARQGQSGLDGQNARLTLAARVLAGTGGPGQGAPQANGAIVGIIYDPTGALVPRASVVAVNTDSGLSWSRTTDNTGSYSFTLLPPGKYNVTVGAAGFARLLQENVVVEVGRTAGLNLKLRVGPTDMTLTITGATSAQEAGAKAPGSTAGPMQVSPGAMAKNLVARPDPVYPPEAKAAHVSGAVVMHAVIAKDGTVKDLKAVSGPDALQASALDAVRRWTYKPYLLNGEPREVETTITVHYTFGGDGAGPVTPPQSVSPASAGSAAGPKPQRVSGGIAAGMLVSKVDPVYPAEAKAARVQGAVVLRAVISKDGEIVDLKVVSGPSELAASAIDAVNQWKYKPYLLNGEPTEVETTITVNYSLGEGLPGDGTPRAAAAFPQAQSEGPDENGLVARPIGHGVSAPMLIYSVDPEYSAEAKEGKLNGTVLVHLWVDAQGKPLHVRVARGAGHGLDEKAVAAVEQYKFKPAMEDGHPVVVALNTEINF